MTKAEQVCRDGDPDPDALARCIAVSESAGTYAYEFVACKDGSKYMVHVANGVIAMAPVDDRGVPNGTPVALEPLQPAQPIQMGHVTQPPAPPEPQKPRRRWMFWRR